MGIETSLQITESEVLAEILYIVRGGHAGQIQRQLYRDTDYATTQMIHETLVDQLYDAQNRFIAEQDYEQESDAPRNTTVSLSVAQHRTFRPEEYEMLVNDWDAYDAHLNGLMHTLGLPVLQRKKNQECPKYACVADAVGASRTIYDYNTELFSTDNLAGLIALNLTRVITPIARFNLENNVERFVKLYVGSLESSVKNTHHYC